MISEITLSTVDEHYLIDFGIATQDLTHAIGSVFGPFGLTRVSQSVGVLVNTVTNACHS